MIVLGACALLGALLHNYTFEALTIPRCRSLRAEYGFTTSTVLFLWRADRRCDRKQRRRLKGVRMDRVVMPILLTARKATGWCDSVVLVSIDIRPSMLYEVVCAVLRQKSGARNALSGLQSLARC